MKKNVRRFLSCLLVLALALVGVDSKPMSSHAATVHCIDANAMDETSPAIDFDIGSIVYYGEAGENPSNSLTTYWGVDKNGVFAFYNLDEKGLPTAKNYVKGYGRCSYYVQGKELRATMTLEAKKAIKYVIGGLNSDMKLIGDGDMRSVFKDCTNLLEVFRLPSSTFADYMFYNCTSLRHVYPPLCSEPLPKEYYYGGNEVRVNGLEGTFYNCVSLRGTLILPVTTRNPQDTKVDCFCAYVNGETFYNISKNIAKDDDTLTIILPYYTYKSVSEYKSQHEPNSEHTLMIANNWFDAYKGLENKNYIHILEDGDFTNNEAVSTNPFLTTYNADHVVILKEWDTRPYADSSGKIQEEKVIIYMEDKKS